VTLTPRGHQCHRNIESFSSKKVRASISNKSAHFLSNSTKNCYTETSRKCEAWASIFVEMIAQASPCSLKLRSCFLSEVLASRSALPRPFFLLFASIFLLSFVKEGRKTRNRKQKESKKTNYKISSNKKTLIKK